MKQTPTFHRDGTISHWHSLSQGRWRTPARGVTPHALAAMTAKQRARCARMVAAELVAIDGLAAAKIGGLLTDFLVAAAEAAVEETA